jgi:hypothetical protein
MPRFELLTTCHFDSLGFRSLRAGAGQPLFRAWNGHCGEWSSD